MEGDAHDGSGGDEVTKHGATGVAQSAIVETKAGDPAATP